MSKELLTTEQLAEKLKVSTVTIYKWRKEGMPHHELGPRSMRYELLAVMKWIEERNQKED